MPTIDEERAELKAEKEALLRYSEEVAKDPEEKRPSPGPLAEPGLRLEAPSGA